MDFNDFNISQSLQQASDRFFEALPTLIFALAVFIIGYLIARALQSGTLRLLNKLDVNQKVSNTESGQYVRQLFPNPSFTVSRVVFWSIMLGVISLTVSVMGITQLNEFVAAIYGYLPNILVAIGIFIAASMIIGGTNRFVSRVLGDTPTGNVVRSTIPAVVMSIAFFMILSQLQIAETIVTITYAAILGALALGLALAFGLGGRDVAARILDNAYESGKKGVEQAKKDAGKSSSKK